MRQRLSAGGRDEGTKLLFGDIRNELVFAERDLGS